MVAKNLGQTVQLELETSEHRAISEIDEKSLVGHLLNESHMLVSVSVLQVTASMEPRQI